MAKVAVYSPEGVREVHTLANARDLVNGAGWSWNPAAPSTPASLSPVQKKAVGKEPAQRVLDGVASDAAVTAAEEVVEDDDVVVDVAAAAVEAAEEVVDAAAPAEAEAAAEAAAEDAAADAAAPAEAAPARRRRKA